MNETCQQAQTFLNDIFSGCQLELSAQATETAEGCLLELDGEDASLLRSEGGELLSALEHLVNQVYGRALSHGARFICDVQNFRATREAELRAMARHAAERVRTTRAPFTFGPMNSNERRIIHTSLAEEPDLHTESIGEGNARRLKVSFKVTG
ncbi:MAG TPA: R3H domain-containing nucleic acid-binding protein [Pyrinomonadaceae bacterium]|nr:R3H domain-containing nucleic acid-binding protein [Pyrinomonadaceae bacterium]